MKNKVQFILFLIYTIMIFLIPNNGIIVSLFVLQIVFMILIKMNLKEAIGHILKLMPFILFTVIINLFMMEWNEAILIGIKLILVCNITDIFSHCMSVVKLSKVIEELLFPLTFFHINVKNIGIMISIAITFIPIMKQEFTNLKYSLMAKGFRYTPWNILRHMNYLMVPLMFSILRKINELEDALKAKAYVEA